MQQIFFHPPKNGTKLGDQRGPKIRSEWVPGAVRIGLPAPHLRKSLALSQPYFSHCQLPAEKPNFRTKNHISFTKTSSFVLLLWRPYDVIVKLPLHYATFAQTVNIRKLLLLLFLCDHSHKSNIGFIFQKFLHCFHISDSVNADPLKPQAISKSLSLSPHLIFDYFMVSVFFILVKAHF